MSSFPRSDLMRRLRNGRVDRSVCFSEEGSRRYGRMLLDTWMYLTGGAAAAGGLIVDVGSISRTSPDVSSAAMPKEDLCVRCGMR